MDAEKLKNLLEEIKKGSLSVDQGLDELKKLPFKELGHSVVDHHREIRGGYPEVIFCQGKATDHILQIVEQMLENGSNVLGTRANDEVFEAILARFPNAKVDKLSRTISIKIKKFKSVKTYISVITAGTSDIPVAEEAAVTAEFYDNEVHRFYDIGVAGIHRINKHLDEIRGARANVVVAGMEGALPSVIGGLVDKPVIAVPTSVGYGASFKGVAALLGMLNSCASGLSVVNIDNGFGAGYLAGMINKL